jgi:hypothetical protein
MTSTPMSAGIDFVGVLTGNATERTWQRGQSLGFDVFAAIMAFATDVLAFERTAYRPDLHDPTVF